jgi:hypothetical protein
MKLYREIGDHKGEGRCLNGVGALFKDLGEPQKARDYLEQALVLRRQTRDRLGEAITLTTLGPSINDWLARNLAAIAWFRLCESRENWPCTARR